MTFNNRQHAGRLLGEKLIGYKSLNPIILALPRGGVPVAAEIATILNAPLDVLIARKIGYPFQQELAVGALSEDYEPVWSERILSRTGLEPDDLGRTILSESKKIKQQIEEFRDGRELPSTAQRTVIIVDDGLATGATVTAAVKYLKKRGAAKIIVAVPIAAAISARQLRGKVDALISLEEPEDLLSVGQWYEEFSQVSNEEVVMILKENQKRNDANISVRSLEIPVDQATLSGDLTMFPSMKALIIFAHGSGSGRKSPRNQMVASELNKAGFGTLLFDLLTDQEAKNRKNVFDINFLSNRLVSVTKWLRQQPDLKVTQLGYFGASTGAGAAIQAASKLSGSDSVYAIVSRGGRPDLAGDALKIVKSPTLLLVGGQDFDVIELNRQAQKLLFNSKLSIVPGATHLFEEPGTLEEVSRLAALWFKDHLELPKLKSKSKQTLDEAVESGMIGVRNENDFDRLIESVKDARVVMLGEASHGTQEFYQIRSLISKRLIKDHGFKFIAVEGDWPDAYRLNKYIQKGEGGNAKAVLMHNHRWPTWMWTNDEIVKLAEWMRTERAGFYGLDVYSFFESIDEVVNYLKKNNLPLAQEIQRRYACLDPFEGDEISYARSLLKYPPGCENEVLLNLQRLLELRVKDVAQDGDELFSSQQNARIVANAETYYRAMLSGDASSWNVRDGHMMETLDRLLERAGEGAKAIVWAHNTHIGDYRATDMKEAGYINLGGLARQSYGEENVALVGFGTYQGEVLAGSGWGRPEEIMPLPAAHEESYEYHFHRAAQNHNLNQFYLLLENKTHTPFAHRLGHRAIGVVYDPRHERRGNYVPTELSKRYDAFVFVDQTHALKSLHTAYVLGEFPETWPTGQ
jgi:putative phosphoribosyl transferase